MSRPVLYYCRQHGPFTASVRCGYGIGPAPGHHECPNCGRMSYRDKEAAKRANRKTLSVPTETYDRLQRFCDAQGISMNDWIDAHVPEDVS